MNYLLDVHLLVAWGWTDHSDHSRVAKWLAAERGGVGTQLLTSAIPELGFVRVSVQRSRGRVTPTQASAVLESMIRSLGAAYAFLPDDEPSRAWPGWCHGAARTTGAHLLRLAQAHGASLATLDRGIPGAYLIP